MALSLAIAVLIPTLIALPAWPADDRVVDATVDDTPVDEVDDTPVDETVVAERETATASDRATSHRSFADVDFWQGVFDDPERAKWQQPAAIVGALGLQKGMRVADIGAGTGYFLPYLAAAVGPDGTVLAVEPEPTLVQHIRTRSEESGLENIVPILGSTDNPRLPAHSVDLILFVDTYHHIDHRTAYLPKLQRFLRKGGRIAIVDWVKRETPKGPPLDHRIARRHVVDEMTAAGYGLVEEPDILTYQFFLIFADAGDPTTGS